MTEYCNNSFGIYQETPIDITLEFDKEEKDDVLNYHFHPTQKMKELEERDRIRNFQPPVDGDEIMKLFNLPPCREVGELKAKIKDAIHCFFISISPL